MKFLYTILFYFIFWYDTFSQVPKSSMDSDALFARQIVDQLPEAEFYFIGQLHNNAANTILEKELLFSMNKRFGVSYDILEYSHSTAVILNEYLLTGQDSLLALINKNANFSFIKSVKQFNDAVSEHRKIKFYGVDFEGRHNGKFTKLAISLILQYQIDKDHQLFHLLKTCEESTSSTLPAKLNQLKKYLGKNIQASKQILGGKYLDVFLIANARYGFSSGRDRVMYDNFKFLYNELSGQLSNKPKFFASFGIGHINPDNPNGIANILNSARDSPVKNGIITLGVQYLNCYFDTSNTFKSSEGIFSFLCKPKPLATIIDSKNNDKALFRFISAKDFNYTFCDTDINKLKGIIIIENFKSTANWTWE